MSQVSVFLYGGTITMTRRAQGGVEPEGLSLEELLPGADLGDVEVFAENVRAVGSSRMSFADVLELVARARSAVLEEGRDGIVVVQGTDTLEEVAFLIDLVWDLDAPVVVTGAMRNPTLPGADGPANLQSAVLTAADAAARGRGALVVLADEIHAGRLVAKSHASRPHAFTSPGFGPVGTLFEGRTCFLGRADRPAPLALPETMPRDVALHT